MPTAPSTAMCVSTFTTSAVSVAASSAPNSPVAAPARSIAERIRDASKDATTPSRVSTERSAGMDSIAAMRPPIDGGAAARTQHVRERPAGTPPPSYCAKRCRGRPSGLRVIALTEPSRRACASGVLPVTTLRSQMRGQRWPCRRSGAPASLLALDIDAQGNHDTRYGRHTQCARQQRAAGRSTPIMPRCYIRSGALTPSRSSARASTMRDASASARRALRSAGSSTTT